MKRWYAVDFDGRLQDIRKIFKNNDKLTDVWGWFFSIKILLHYAICILSKNVEVFSLLVVSVYQRRHGCDCEKSSKLKAPASPLPWAHNLINCKSVFLSFIGSAPEMAITVKISYNLMWLMTVAHGLRMQALFAALMKRRQLFALRHTTRIILSRY